MNSPSFMPLTGARDNGGKISLIGESMWLTFSGDGLSGGLDGAMGRSAEQGGDGARVCEIDGDGVMGGTRCQIACGRKNGRGEADLTRNHFWLPWSLLHVERKQVLPRR